MQERARETQPGIARTSRILTNSVGAPVPNHRSITLAILTSEPDDSVSIISTVVVPRLGAVPVPESEQDNPELDTSPGVTPYPVINSIINNLKCSGVDPWLARNPARFGSPDTVRTVGDLLVLNQA